MRAVVQRVKHASVKVDGKVVGSIENGLLVFLGVEKDDSEEDLAYMVDKVTGLRVFEDENGKMNLSVQDVGGAVLAVSQFTLYGDCRKGRRPSFTQAAPPDMAKKYYDLFVEKIKQLNIPVATGIFQAKMEVSLLNDGPVTILLDSKRTF
ncbi:MAG: D-aminoacyl-tRNA deacylase [Caldicoprobacter sp.]|uniref:D-aminoacyl-tRNA deacylase n=1 Tax=Caldicoprobacter sp. TaxID=2004500 RepID=UPI001D7CF64F|nr:D-tyrosyl-tRNA(Tyr) deacylase [Clostridia bacterium]